MSALPSAIKKFMPNKYRVFMAYRRFRQWWFITQIQIQAKWVGSTVDIDLSPDLIIGRGVRVRVWGNTHNTVKFGPKSRIGDNVNFQLKGGSITAGIRTDLRAQTSVQIDGDLVLDGENTISYGCVLHCGTSIHLGYAAIMAEYSSLADSTHFHTTPDDPVGENVSFAPIDIGRNTFICPRVSVGRGVTIGPWSVIGPSSVVSKDIPAGVFASGVPAKVVRELDHPWMDDVNKGVAGAPDQLVPVYRRHQK